jgi:virginiamycin B lyase
MMKELLICSILVFVLFFYIKPVEVAAIPSDQSNILIKSWALPMQSNQNSNFAVTTSFSGNEVYYVDSNSNTIGRLVPETNTITEWNIPTANSLPTSVMYHPSGNVYFIGSNSNTIGRLVPETNTITEWTIQSNSSDFSIGNNSGIADNNRQFGSLNVDSSTGNVYFIESNSNTIGRLVPETNTITEWTIQSNTTNLKSMALGFSGSNEVYYVDSNSNTIGRLAPTTNLITEWNIPTANSLPTSIKFDRTTGNVYFIESNSNTIGRLAPFSSEFTEWNLQEKPSDIEVDSSGSIHYIDENGTKIVRMD